MNDLLKFTLSAVCALGLLSGCSLWEADAPETPSAPPTRSVLSARVIKPEAEQLHAKARVLWGDTDVCSDPEKAIAYLNSALEIEPEYPDALLRRGLAFWQLGHPEDAFENLTQAVRLAPAPEVYAWRAQLLLDEGNLQGARQDAEHALRLNSGAARAHGVLGAVLLEEKKNPEACDAFARAARNGMPVFLERARDAGLCK